MLQSVSWGAFIRFLLFALFLYYGYVIWRFGLWKEWKWPDRRKPGKFSVLLGVMLLLSTLAMAQADGNAGINQANTLMRTYFDTAVNLMYAVAGVCGLIGAVEAFMKIHRGQDAGRSVAIWFGGCLFIALAAYVIKSFFGLT